MPPGGGSKLQLLHTNLTFSGCCCYCWCGCVVPVFSNGKEALLEADLDDLGVDDAGPASPSGMDAAAAIGLIFSSGGGGGADDLGMQDAWAAYLTQADGRQKEVAEHHSTLQATRVVHDQEFARIAPRSVTVGGGVEDGCGRQGNGDAKQAGEAGVQSQPGDSAQSPIRNGHGVSMEWLPLVLDAVGGGGHSSPSVCDSAWRGSVSDAGDGSAASTRRLRGRADDIDPGGDAVVYVADTAEQNSLAAVQLKEREERERRDIQSLRELQLQKEVRSAVTCGDSVLLRAPPPPLPMPWCWVSWLTQFVRAVWTGRGACSYRPSPEGGRN
jgi:hypothetical protein